MGFSQNRKGAVELSSVFIGNRDEDDDECGQANPIPRSVALGRIARHCQPESSDAQQCERHREQCKQSIPGITPEPQEEHGDGDGGHRNRSHNELFHALL